MRPRAVRASSGKTSWLGRLTRRWRPDHNPLRRGSDLAELAVRVLLVAAFAWTAPFAAHAAARWADNAASRELQAQQVNFRQVHATLTDAPTTIGGYGATTTRQADARWIAPDGQVRSGLLIVPPSAVKGSIVPIWTDHAGDLVTPLNRDQIPQRDGLAAAAAVAVLAIVALTGGWLVSRRLDRRRMAAWDAEWLRTEPRWTSRR